MTNGDQLDHLCIWVLLQEEKLGKTLKEKPVQLMSNMVFGAPAVKIWDFRGWIKTKSRNTLRMYFPLKWIWVFLTCIMPCNMLLCSNLPNVQCQCRSQTHIHMQQISFAMYRSRQCIWPCYVLFFLELGKIVFLFFWGGMAIIKECICLGTLLSVNV